MSFPDNLPTFAMSPLRFATTDAIDVRLQFPMNNEPLDPHSMLDQLPQAKRVRTSESDHHHNNNNNASSTTMANPQNPALNNKGTSHIFFKTRMCTKFRLGACRNGENCNFAHGLEDMRQPPPNWQEMVGLRGGGGGEDRLPPPVNWDDDHKMIHKMKLCKKFYNGEECPYGERCSFLHEVPGKFRDDPLRFRESSAISIGTNGSPPRSYGGDGPKSPPRAVNSGDFNVSRGNGRSTYWKTKLCTKWETTSHCPFGGDCHFAHGQAELQVLGGRTEAEFAGVILTSSMATIPPTLPNVPPLVHASDAHPNNAATVPPANEQGQQGKKSLLKWKGFNKINRIYGDWLDDLPPVQNLSSGVET